MSEHKELLSDLGNNCLDRDDLEFIENDEGEQFLSMSEVDRACIFGYEKGAEELAKYKAAYLLLKEANDFYCSGSGVDGDEEFMEPDDLCPFGGEQHGKHAREANKKVEEILK